MLVTLNSSYKWSYTVFVFLGLDDFIQLNVLKGYPCCSVLEFPSFF